MANWFVLAHCSKECYTPVTLCFGTMPPVIQCYIYPCHIVVLGQCHLSYNVTPLSHCVGTMPPVIQCYTFVTLCCWDNATWNTMLIPLSHCGVETMPPAMQCYTPVTLCWDNATCHTILYLCHIVLLGQCHLEYNVISLSHCGVITMPPAIQCYTPCHTGMHTSRSGSKQLMQH